MQRVHEAVLRHGSRSAHQRLRHDLPAEEPPSAALRVVGEEEVLLDLLDVQELEKLC